MPSALPPEDTCGSCLLIPLIKSAPQSELKSIKEEWKSGDRFKAIRRLREVLNISLGDAVAILDNPRKYEL
jgi:hypothetical protein